MANLTYISYPIAEDNFFFFQHVKKLNLVGGEESLRTTLMGSMSRHPIPKQFLINGEKLEHWKYQVAGEPPFFFIWLWHALLKSFCG